MVNPRTLGIPSLGLSPHWSTFYSALYDVTRITYKRKNLSGRNEDEIRMKMISFGIVCLVVGVVGGVPLKKESGFTPFSTGAKPPCAAKYGTVCESVDNYPTKLIHKLLSSKFSSFDDFFTDESEGLEEPPEFLFQEEKVLPEDSNPREFSRHGGKSPKEQYKSQEFFRQGRTIRQTEVLHEPQESFGNAGKVLRTEDAYKPTELPSSKDIAKLRRGRSVRDDGSSVQDIEKACPVLDRSVRPQLAANSQGEWRFIVQNEDNNQTVQVQLCSQNEECRGFCTQFHSRVSLVSIDRFGKFHKDSFWLPSSCLCQTQPLEDM